MAAFTFQRYEMKYCLSEEQYRNLLPVIEARMEPDAHCREGRFYSIYNVYFDTEDEAIIRASLRRPCHKEKLRLRSYLSPVPKGGIVYLEMKKKTAGIVHKRRAEMTIEDAEKFLSTGEFTRTESYIRTQVLEEIRFFMRTHAVKPAVYICYRRRAFFDPKDSNFRVTFDDEIRACRENASLKGTHLSEDILPGNRYLMEIKTSGAVPKWLAESLSENHIFRTHFSKYGTEYLRRNNAC